MNMVDLNIKALHILTKLFVQRFIDQNKGRVLNIGSLAAFTPAPVLPVIMLQKLMSEV